MNSSAADSDPALPADLAAAALQSGALRDEPPQSAETVDSSLTARQQLADQLWLDTLLTQAIHPQEATRRQDRVNRVMSALQHNSVSTTDGKTARRRWWTSLASLAAVIVLGALFLAPHLGPQSALASVERSLQVASEDVDRQYRIVLNKPDVPSPLPITLTVRGARRFVWEQPVVLGTMRVGCNGDEYWMVPSVGPVIVAAEGSLLERLLSEKPMTTPILTLTTALEWLRDRYELERLPDEDVSSGENPGGHIRCEHIRGRLRNSDEILKPSSIDLWCDRRTGIVQHLTAEWPAGTRFGPLQGDVRLQATPGDLPAEWYEHGHHHRENRVVIRRPS